MDTVHIHKSAAFYFGPQVKREQIPKNKCQQHLPYHTENQKQYKHLKKITTKA
jgi:hypothetical protein